MSSGSELWATDGEHYDTKKEIYKNQGIEDFLSDNDSIKFLVSTKGMGKTLLLNKKRNRVQGRNGVLVIPENKEADYVQLTDSLGKNWQSFLKTKHGWADLWEFSIAVSLLSYVAHEQLDSIEQDLTLIAQALPRDWKLVRDINNPRSFIKHNPSDIISLILHSTPKQFHELRSARPWQRLFRTYTSVRHGVYIFIDSFDQALLESMNGYFDSEVWTNGQVGLIEAAYKINRHNPHIKIFATIRSEAYANSEQEDAMSMAAQVFRIRYNQEDIRQLLNVLIQEYEHKQDIYDFVGINTVPVRGVDEDVFDYAYRHTLGKPRGVAVLGNSIRQQGGKASRNLYDSRLLQKLISESSATDIIQNYLYGEMYRFQTWLKDRKSIDELFSLIPYNILTRGELKRIADRFTRAIGLEPKTEAAHPFCELYNLGLLGVLHEDVHDPVILRQQFITADGFRWGEKELLPDSDFYVLHPALAFSLARKYPRFKQNPIALIGYNAEWREEYKKSVNNEITRIFVSYSSSNQQRVENVVNRLSNNLDSVGARHWFWYDKWRIKGGSAIQPAIEEGLHKCDILLLFYTSQAKKSGWVEKEWQTVYRKEIDERKIRIIPITDLNITDGDDAGIGLLVSKKFRKLPSPNSELFNEFIQQLSKDIRFHSNSNNSG